MGGSYSARKEGRELKREDSEADKEIDTEGRQLLWQLHWQRCKLHFQMSRCRVILLGTFRCSRFALINTNFPLFMPGIII